MIKIMRPLLILLCMTVLSGCAAAPRSFVTVQQSMDQPSGQSFALLPPDKGMQGAPAEALPYLRRALLDAGLRETTPESADLIVTHWLVVPMGKPIPPRPAPTVGMDPVSKTAVVRTRRARTVMAPRRAILSIHIFDGPKWRDGISETRYQSTATTELAQLVAATAAAQRLVEAMFADFPGTSGATRSVPGN